jgi:heme exporter protein D
MGFEGYSVVLNIGGLIFQYVFLAVLIILSFLVKLVLLLIDSKDRNYQTMAKKIYEKEQEEDD